MHVKLTVTFVCINQCTQSELDIDSVRSILSEYRIANADITLRYDANADDLIDVIEGNRQVMLRERSFHFICFVSFAEEKIFKRLH